MFVLDCSATVAFLFEDEISEASEDLLQRVKVDGALVPSIWSLELGNVLAQAERRGKITEFHAYSYLQVIMDLPISMDSQSQQLDTAIWGLLTLARAYSLTTYDAAYLELAMRRGLALATRDKSLLRAARQVGVGTLGV